MLYKCTQIEDLQLSERLLKSKVKSLTRELTVLRTRFTPSGKKKLSESDPGERNARLKTTYSGSKFHSSARKSRRNFPSQHIVLHKARTRSPVNVQVPRFDPTAYVEHKKKLQLERKASLVR